VRNTVSSEIQILAVVQNTASFELCEKTRPLFLLFTIILQLWFGLVLKRASIKIFLEFAKVSIVSVFVFCECFC
jgi:hypothetical protein